MGKTVVGWGGGRRETGGGGGGVAVKEVEVLMEEVTVEGPSVVVVGAVMAVVARWSERTGREGGQWRW